MMSFRGTEGGRDDFALFRVLKFRAGCGLGGVLFEGGGRRRRGRRKM